MTRFALLLLLFIPFLCTGRGWVDSNLKPFVVPEVKEWRGDEGTFVLTTSARIVYAQDSPAAERVARALAEDCRTLLGMELQTVAEKKVGPMGKADRHTHSVGNGEGLRSTVGDVVLTIRLHPTLGAEGYILRIGERIELSASAEAGLYWGTRTLLQLAAQSASRILPHGTIRDFPDYGVRGFMIDCGRKFIPMDFLYKYVDILSYYKMNTLQIHLNDNGFPQYFDNDWNKTYAAFRLESEVFPSLAAQDGFYTKDEFRRLQQHAAEKGVEIIPEIDVPAHSLAFSRYKPEIGSKEYGMDHLDLSNPATYEFLDALFSEYLSGDDPVFSGRRVSIGSDEYSNRDSNTVEQFRALTDRYIRLVESFGKQACLWGALTHAKGATPVKAENVSMNIWYNGYADPREMAEAGYQIISIPDGFVYIVPAAGYYSDYLDTKFLYENWTPAHVGDIKFEERAPSILGGMFAVWNDHVGNGISIQDIHDRTFPALQTLSVKMWTGEGVSIPYEEFDRLRRPLDEAPGVNLSGRLSQVPSEVLHLERLEPCSRLPYAEIGYDYRVEFNIECAEETPGTELFRFENSVFYLSDPIRGMLGFARDGYLNTFRRKLRPGEKLLVAVEGDNRATRLYINGDLAEELNIRKIWFNEGKNSMSYVRTLVFPLQESGIFKSKITHLRIFQK